MAWLGKHTLDVVSQPATRRTRRRVKTRELEVLSDVAKLAVGGPRKEELRTHAERQALQVEAELEVTDARGPAEQ
eukprot:14815300-Heterocapsa_arctica.AAC.1